MTGAGKDARVRWRQGTRWRHGFLVSDRPGVNDTVQVRLDRGGPVHTVPRSGIEQETTGPRGGHHWAPLAPPATALVRPKRPRRKATELDGQLAMFDSGEPGR